MAAQLVHYEQPPELSVAVMVTLSHTAEKARVLAQNVKFWIALPIGLNTITPSMTHLLVATGEMPRFIAELNRSPISKPHALAIRDHSDCHQFA